MMKDQFSVVVIIPALNEEKAISKVIEEILRPLVSEVVVGNNGSVDQTESVAIAAGATVVTELEPGYGATCLKAMDHIARSEKKPDVIVFLDGDHSDYPEEIPLFKCT